MSENQRVVLTNINYPKNLAYECVLRKGSNLQKSLSNWLGKSGFIKSTSARNARVIRVKHIEAAIYIYNKWVTKIMLNF